MGRFENGISSEKAWIFERSFKTPTVRNVALTRPLLSQWCLPILLDVVNFYDLGGAGGMSIDAKNQTLSSDHLNLE